MTNKPIIGVLLSETTAEILGPVNTVHYSFANYITAVERADAIPIGIPVIKNRDDIQPVLNLCDGLLIPGGEDVDPRHYQQEPHPLLGSTHTRMDDMWIATIHAAISQNIPILGICKGLQIVNVALGGTLFQDISLATDNPIAHVQQAPRERTTHAISIAKHSHLGKALNASQLFVNSFHHQSSDQVAEGLQVVATASDGIVEGLENTDGSIMLVQWHPEELLETEQAMQQLFNYFVDKAREFSCSNIINKSSKPNYPTPSSKQ